VLGDFPAQFRYLSVFEFCHAVNVAGEGTRAGVAITEVQSRARRSVVLNRPVLRQQRGLF
jgi:hypothetical protein